MKNISKNIESMICIELKRCPTYLVGFEHIEG